MEIFRLSSTPIKVHWTLAAIIGFVAGWQYTMFGAADAFIIVVAGLSIFGSVLLHEIAHSLVAKDFGYETESIVLYPFGGVARVVMPQDAPPEHELYIASSGPLLNAAIGTFLLIPAWFLGYPFGLLALLNLGMFVLNMLPIYPLDGGRVLRSLLSRSLGHETSTTIVTYMSRVFAWVFAITSAVLMSPLLVAVGLYLVFLTHHRIRKGGDIKIKPEVS